MFYKFYVNLGCWLFWALLPIMRMFIKKTHRTYSLIVKDDKILVLKNWLSDGKWALPGGGVGSRETSQEAIKRELKEELNIVSSEKLELFTSGIWQNHGFGFKYDLYLIRGDLDFRINRKLEITDVTWLDKSSLDINNTAIDIVNALAKL